MNSRRNFLQKLTVLFFTMPFLSAYTPAGCTGALLPHQEGPVLRVAIMGLGQLWYKGR